MEKHKENQLLRELAHKFGPYDFLIEPIIGILSAESLKKDSKEIEAIIKETFPDEMIAKKEQFIQSEIEMERQNIYNIARIWRKSFFILGNITIENIEKEKETLSTLIKELLDKTVCGGVSAYDAYIECLNWLMKYGELYEETFNLVKNKNFNKSKELIESNPKLIRKIIDHYNHISDPLIYRKNKIASQQHRRFENNNTIAKRLERWLGVTVDLDKEKEQYDQLCHVMEKIAYKSSDDEDNSGQRKRWNIRWGDVFCEGNVPLDLLDFALEGKDRYGKKYRPFIRRLVARLSEITDKYVEYDLSLQRFEKTYKIINSYMWYMMKTSRQVEEDVKKYKDIVKANLKKYDYGHNSPQFSGDNDLFSRVLLGIFKIHIKNLTRQRQYINDHTNIFSAAQPLSLNARRLLARMNQTADMNNSCSLEQIENIILKTHKEEVQSILDGKNILPIYKKAWKVANSFCNNDVDGITVLLLMICCTCPQNYTLNIDHFGLSRGQVQLSLQKIIKKPEIYYCKETRLFITFLIRRTAYINIYGKEMADKFWDLALFIDDQIQKDICQAASWHELAYRIERMCKVYQAALDEI